MNVNIYAVDAGRLNAAIQSIPVVYPPELSFLGKTPILEAWVIKAMLASRVYVAAGAPFLAFSSDAAKDRRRFLTLLVTTDSLAGGLSAEALTLLRELYRPPRRVGWLERFIAQRQADKRHQEQIRRGLAEGTIDEQQAAALSQLYFPVFHDDDVVVAIPEDDFTKAGGGSRGWEDSMKSSGIKSVCKNLRPLRCGIPKSFCNQLLTKLK